MVQLNLDNLSTLAFPKTSLYVTYLTLKSKTINAAPLQLTAAWTRICEKQKSRGYHSCR